MVFIALSTSAIFGQQPVTTTQRETQPMTTEVTFSSHDGHEMFGRLTVPPSGNIRAVVIRVQTAEGMTLGSTRHDVRNLDRRFDAYAKTFPEFGVALFRYEGRGIRTGDKPPKYELIDREIYDTSSLENKVRDILSAIAAVQKQPSCSEAKIILLGASEGALLAAEAAARRPELVHGIVLEAILPGNLRESLRYALVEGQFLRLQRQFDDNGDQKITKKEYEDDKKGYRKKTALKSVEFSDLDRNGDGVLTVDDIRIMCKEYLDALQKQEWQKLDEWVSISGATRPKGWLKDHFDHKPIWTSLEKLDMPVGIFHGQDDAVCSVEDVKKLERLAQKAKKSNMEFRYFDAHDHSLNADEFSSSSGPSKGQAAVIDFVRELANR